MHPCFPPDLIINQSDVTLPSTTVRSKPTYMPSITLTILSGISQLLMIFDNLSLCTESKAFSKSTTKCAYRPALDSFACPKMFLSIKICSVVFLLGQNPACSFRSFLSMPFLIRFNRILQDILLMRGSKVTPAVVAFVQTKVLEYVNNKSLLPHFPPTLSFPKPVVTTSQPTCSVFMSALNNYRHTLCTPTCFPWICPLQCMLDLL